MAVRSPCVIAGKYHLERTYCTPMRCLALLLHVATSQHHSLGPGRGTWSVGIPEDFGMDSELLSRAAAEVGRVGAERYCLLIAKDGVIVSETYYKNTSESTYESDSLGKTITASLLGVAVQHGLLDLDTPLVQYGVRPRGNWSVSGTDYFPEVTMRHLLTQSSGYGTIPPGSRMTYDSDAYIQHISYAISDILERRTESAWAGGRGRSILRRPSSRRRSGFQICTCLIRLAKRFRPVAARWFPAATWRAWGSSF